MEQFLFKKYFLSVIFFIFIGFEVQGEVVQGIYGQEIIEVLHRQVLKNDFKGLGENLEKYPMHINAIDYKGNSLLHNAVRWYNTKMVEFLLSKGADVNFQHIQSRGNTALHYSKLSEITQKLIDHGALPDILNMYRSSPLLVHVRETGLTAENIHILLEAGAETDIVSPKKFTALHFLFAIEMKDRDLSDSLKRQRFNKVLLQIAEDLIVHGVDVNASNKYGRTALHYAARRGYVEAIEFLVDHGAKIDAVDSRNQTPMMYAMGKEAMDSVATLLRLGGRADIPDNRGTSVEGLLRKYENRDHRFPRLVALIDQQTKEGHCASLLLSEQSL